MNGTYEIDPSMTWHDIERNKEHLKKDGEHYVADAILFRENANLRQENDSLKKENEGLRKEIDRLVMNSTPTATEIRRVRAEWKKDRDESAKLRELVDEVHEMLCADRVGMFHRLILTELEDGMRELGIEVKQ